jgi:hypothetical protein
LRNLFQKKQVPSSFAAYLEDDNAPANSYDEIYDQFGEDIPSYEHFSEAAEEAVPSYKVELARSNRSQCNNCKPKPAREKVGKGRAKAVPALTVAATSAVVKSKKGQKKDYSGGIYIPNGALRVGSLESEAGTYGRWHHLTCWRVPYRVWSGLTKPKDKQVVDRDLTHMDEVLLTGFVELDEEQRGLFCEHVMDPNNWAKKINRKKSAESKAAPAAESTKKRTKPTVGTATEPPFAESTNKRDKKPTGKKSKKSAKSSDATSQSELPSDAVASVPDSTASAIVKHTAKKQFIVPSPGVGGAVDASFLAGKTFVMTGLFPEVGGVTGLSLGKDKVLVLLLVGVDGANCEVDWHRRCPLRLLAGIRVSTHAPALRSSLKTSALPRATAT